MLDRELKMLELRSKQRHVDTRGEVMGVFI